MEVFRGKYNHAGFFKRKKEKKKAFSGECGFFIYASQTGPKFVKKPKSSTNTLPCLCC